MQDLVICLLLAFAFLAGYMISLRRTQKTYEYVGPEEEEETQGEQEFRNEMPVIGVMTYNRIFEGYNEYNMAVYSRFVEQCGGRAVPIHFYLTETELEAILERVNGVIIPGGITKLINDKDNITSFCKHIQIILRKSKELFDRGVHLPVFGVCLGLQGIAVAEAPHWEVLGVNTLNSVDMRANMIAYTDFDETKIHKKLSKKLRKAIQTEKICYDSHHDGVKPEFFTKYESLKDYKVVLTSLDRDGIESVQCIEHKKYPIYAVQYHPEKIAYLWRPENDVPRSANALELSRHYINYFIDDCRKSKNVYGTDEELRADLFMKETMLFTDSNSQDIYVYKTHHGIQA